MTFKHLWCGLLAAGGAAVGSAPALAEAEPLMGQISLTAATYCPKDWAEPNGQLITIAQNQALYSLYGTTYGGDGITTFGSPDLRGRALVHTGTKPGGGTLVLGAVEGGRTVTLSRTTMPAHQHALYASPVAATLPSPAGNDLGEFVGGTIPGYSSQQPSAGNAMAPTILTEVGGNQAFEIRQPALVMRYCFAVLGTYPSRN